MKFQALFMVLFTTLLFASPASGQINGGDIGDIFGEIFKGQRRGPDQSPQSRSLIENIPVDIRFDSGANGLPVESMLIVTAYAPPPPNVRRSSPLMIGQTRLLLNGLESPLSIVIAAPATVTRDLDYVNIEAKILNANGNPIFNMENLGEYRGYEAPMLTLNRIGQIAQPQPQNPNNLSYETVRGTVVLNGTPPSYRGSNLTVRLIEDGLAGGTSRFIAGEHRQTIDQKTAPFSFELKRVIDPAHAQTPLAFEVWIEDWAGRKTHVSPRPTPYNGSTARYRLPLDTIRVGNDALPEQPSIPPVISEREIEGKARFDAYKGLPKGSILTAELERVYTSGRPTKIAQTRVQLDGLSGDVNFNFTAPETAFDPRLPTPILRVSIKNKDGKLFFSNPGGMPLQRGMNIVQLQTSSGY